MDDQFMLSGRRDPSPDLARRVRATLNRANEEAALNVREPRRALRAASFATALLLVAAAFSLPSVRAGARAFLDLFRVVNFAPVSVDTARLQKLSSPQLDLPRLLGEQIEVLKEPGKPQEFPTPEAAGAAAGLHVRLPAWQPVGWERGKITMIGESAARVTADTRKLSELLTALQIDDLSVPEEIDGQQATISIPPVVHVWYREVQSQDSKLPGRGMMLLQARAPVVAFPSGLDLPVLAEIGMRVLGVAPSEAHRFAQEIDWRTTLIVPIPAKIGSFRRINVQGNEGIFIRGEAAERNRMGISMVLWSSGDTVFALQGQMRQPELLEVAESMQ